MTDRELLAEALEVMLSAINSGDWKVDGACDPHATFVRLTNQLSKPESDAVLAEPVAWIVDGEIKVRLDMAGKLYYSETNVYEKDVVEQAIQQEPVAFVSGYTNGECVVMPMNPAVVFSVGTALYNAPVHAIDMSQERVDETAKRKHEPVAWREVVGKTTKYYDYNEEGRGEPLYAAPQPDLARVGEVGVWGEEKNT
jgi:hypothetical protein